MNGRQLASALVVIALLAFVLPPVAAHRVNHARIARAHAEVHQIAESMAKDSALMLEAGPVVLAGSGVAPKNAETAAWPEPRATRAGVVPADPWGNHYLVVLPAKTGEAVAVLSAGPNGIVETRFESVMQAGPAFRSPDGDDITATRTRIGAQ